MIKRQLLFKIRNLLIAIFLIGIGYFLVNRAISRKRLLILHSYATNYEWVKGVNQGLNDVFKKNRYYIRWHYMDTKRHPSEPFKQKAAAQAIALINKWEPNVIIAIDDNAQKYVGMKYNNHKKISLVFAGVGARPGDYGYHKAKNVTGILETIPLKALKDTMLQIFKHNSKTNIFAPRFYHISDSSVSAESNLEQILFYDWGPLDYKSSHLINTFAEWKKHVLIANSSADFLLTTNYHTLKRNKDSNEIVTASEVVNWTEKNLTIPSINPWGFYVKDGGMLSIGVSPLEQGLTAAKMAVEILDGHKIAEQISIKNNKLFLVYIREKLMKKRNINIPIIYETFARSTHNYY